MIISAHVVTAWKVETKCRARLGAQVTFAMIMHSQAMSRFGHATFWSRNGQSRGRTMSVLFTRPSQRRGSIPDGLTAVKWATARH